MSQLISINPNSYGIEPKEADELLLNLKQLKAEKEILREQYNQIITLDIDDPKTWKLAGEVWSKLRDNRTKGIEPWRKSKKEWFLRGGQFIDATAKIEVEDNQRMEDNLEPIKKRKEFLEKEKQDALKAERLLELMEYKDFVPSGIDLGTMSEDEYKKIYNGAKLQFDAKVAEDLRLEEERLENQRLDEAERNRRIEIAPYVQFLSHSPELRSMSDADYKKLLESLVAAKKSYDDEQDKIRLENERLTKEAEDKKAEDKRRGELLKPLLAFVSDYAEMLLLTKEDFEAKLTGLNKEKKAQDDFEASEILRKQTEMEARGKEALEFLLSEGFGELESGGVKHTLVQWFMGSNFYSEFESDAELKAFKSETSLQVKKLLDQKADDDRKAKDAQDAIDAENLAKAPIKEQLKAWIDQFKLPDTSVDNEVSKEIIAKFESFRTWSVKVVDNL